MVRTKQAESKQTRQSVNTPPSEVIEAAIRVRTVLDGGPIPDFIRDAVVDAIADAAERTCALEPEVHPEQGYDLEALAYLFEVAWTLDLRAPGYTITPTQALAAHLSVVLKHPDTPARLEHAIGVELAAMLNSLDHDTPDMIERVLEAYKKQESEKEGGSEDDYKS